VKRMNLTLAIVAPAALAAMYLTAHPCDVDGRHDPACKAGKP
jgi:hypothetical protein